MADTARLSIPHSEFRAPGAEFENRPPPSVGSYERSPALATECAVLQPARMKAFLLASLALAVTATAADKIKVLIVDGQNNHKWKETTPVLKQILEEPGIFTHLGANVRLP